MQKTQSGFTLIEIAIVLVIIGLLLGGIVKGQELINSAKVKNLAGDFRAIPLLIYSYQDKYRALPGDDAAAATHLSGATAATTPAASQGNGVINGNWNSATPTDETYLVWQHLRLANLTTGSTTPGASDYLPGNALGGVLGLQSGTSLAASSPIKDGAGNPLRGIYLICSSGVAGKYVKQLDEQLDDGNTASGAMLATPTSGYAIGASATPTASIDESVAYTVCMGI